MKPEIPLRDDDACRQVGIVVIGRNEGDRLRRCLRSVIGQAAVVVYVDSGSTDDSLEVARAIGADVMELDLSRHFTMARARNAGFTRLMAIAPTCQFVQFVDGDCELMDGWNQRAQQELECRADVAVVCGRRRERFRDASIYNRLIDMEWDVPSGNVKACGGDVMIRSQVFKHIGGFKEMMIAGEEPELCVRIRQAGQAIVRLPVEMTLHDAAMTRFGQWWKRTMRGGHAYAEGAALHAEDGERRNTRRVRSIWLWGMLLPLLLFTSIAIASWSSWAFVFAVLIIVAYSALVWRVYRVRRGNDDTAADAVLYAMFCTLGKFPQSLGVALYHWNRLSHRDSVLIEYKESVKAT